MNRNHLHGALIAIFPILVSIATGFIVSAVRSAPPGFAMVICLLILTAALRMGGQKQAEPARSPREPRESRRRALPR